MFINWIGWKPRRNRKELFKKRKIMARASWINWSGRIVVSCSCRHSSLNNSHLGYMPDSIRIPFFVGTPFFSGASLSTIPGQARCWANRFVVGYDLLVDIQPMVNPFLLSMNYSEETTTPVKVFYGIRDGNDSCRPNYFLLTSAITNEVLVTLVNGGIVVYTQLASNSYQVLWKQRESKWLYVSNARSSFQTFVNKLSMLSCLYNIAMFTCMFVVMVPTSLCLYVPYKLCCVQSFVATLLTLQVFFKKIYLFCTFITLLHRLSWSAMRSHSFSSCSLGG